MDQRAHSRASIWFPVTLVADGEEEVWGVCKDASAGGLLLCCAKWIDPGQNVKVAFRLTPDDPVERRVAAKVVRADKNEDDPNGFWPHHIGIEFDEPLPELDRDLERTFTET